MSKVVALACSLLLLLSAVPVSGVTPGWQDRLHDSYLRELQDTFTNSVGIEFRYVRPGRFLMGSDDPEAAPDEGPVHEVQIPGGFYLGVKEVTQAQWEEVMGYNPSYFSGPDLPVEKVAWLEAVEFVRRLNEREGTTRYALPTEAEWEYACRAGTRTPYWWGDAPDPLCAWHLDNAGMKTHVGGTCQPNPWGFCDMAGNVSEWCSDPYQPYPGSAMEPPAQDDQPTPVLRGGTWASHGCDLRSGNRSRLWQHYKLSTVGLRLKAAF